MISIVICSINSARFDAVCEQYRAALGNEPYEIIRVPDAKSMCEGYNRGLSQSRGDVIVFSHDDIEIHAADFRARLLGHLERCDVAGVAGSTQLCGPAWAWAGPPFLYGQVGQYHRAQNLFEAATFAVPARHVGNMQALDGMFIACHRKVVLATPFDEQTFTGFHHYDLDFTYRAFLSGFRLAVCCDLDMIHFSDGTWNDAWKASAARFMQKYAGKLPERPRPPNWNRMSVRVATRQELLPRLRPPHWEFS